MNGDVVVLTKADYDALVERGEDAEDKAALAAARAREEALGEDTARADYLPLALIKRRLAGEHPVRIWREHRGMTGNDLAMAAGVQPGYLSEIENRKKPGSLDAVLRLARILKVAVEDLVASTAAALVFDSQFHAKDLGECHLWADEPTFGRVHFIIGREIMVDVLRAGNPVSNRRMEEVAERKRNRIEAACRRAFERVRTDHVRLLAVDFDA
jgi:transcriptional regulator with XRE-family HTH domain